MSIKLIKDELSNMANASLAHQANVYKKIANQSNSIKHLIEIVFEVDIRLSTKAARVLELILKQHLYDLEPFVDVFFSTTYSTFSTIVPSDHVPKFAN